MLVAALWIAVLAVIAGMQLLREVPVDAAVFALVALLLALDAAGLLPALPARPRIPPLLLLGVGAAVAAALALAPRHGAAAGAAVAAAGIAAAVLAWPDPGGRADPGRDPAPLRRAIAGWGLVLLGLALLELVSFLLGRATAETKQAHPAISDLLDPVLDHPLGQAVFAAAWVAAGIGLLTRAGPR